ncbi:3'-5' exoribonuclease YhaM family protein [Desulfovibrio inopinatus]|uniref:3'-5' exoribonuclease YhaM family protein n=1 Tax=Desulfovibrio inopinatus TaxID=102109 RepID=UPI00041BD9EA|nr:HD domain-containing protein [Desulfovibrio inopinatus]
MGERKDVTVKSIFIENLARGMVIEDMFLITSARPGQAKNGPFWSLVLEDVTGSIETKIWSPLSQAFSDIPPGSFVLAGGAVGEYRDKLQLTLDHMTFLDPEADGLDMADFIQQSAIPPQELYDALLALCNDEFQHKPWKRFCKKVLTNDTIRERVLAAPGAKSIHHAYRGGLLEHTLGVCRLCLAICALYDQLDRETLLAAAIFHDLGKAWELVADVSRDYTSEGRLLGHITITQQILDPFLQKAKDLDEELKLHFRHLLLSHHGELEFGSPKRPKTPEAFVLHFADNIDAKLKTGFEALADTEENGQSWSAFVPSLGRALFCATKTPCANSAGRGNKTEDNKGVQQCLLPLKA